MHVNIVIEKLFLSCVFSVFYEVGSLIPLPFLYNIHILSSGAQNKVALFSGGNSSEITLFCLGIGPLICAQMFFQIIQYVNSDLNNYFTQNKNGRKNKAILMQLIVVSVSLIEAAFYLNSINKDISGEARIRTALLLLLGTLVLNWLTEQWSKKAIGEGVSMIVFLGIINNFLLSFHLNNMSILDNGLSYDALKLLIVFLFTCICVWGSQINIRLKTSSLISDVKESDNQSFIPLKINSTGVMPLVFVNVFFYTINVVVNATHLNFLTKSSSILSTVIMLAVYCTILLVTTFSYTYLCLNPKLMQKNLRRSGVAIIGLSGGALTERFVEQLLRKLSFYNFVFLLIISIFSYLCSKILINSLVPISGSSILISVIILSQALQEFNSLKFKIS